MAYCLDFLCLILLPFKFIKSNLKRPQKQLDQVCFIVVFLLCNCGQEADLHVFISRNMHGHGQAHHRKELCAMRNLTKLCTLHSHMRGPLANKEVGSYGLMIYECFDVRQETEIDVLELWILQSYLVISLLNRGMQFMLPWKKPRITNLKEKLWNHEQSGRPSYPWLWTRWDTWASIQREGLHFLSQKIRKSVFYKRTIHH